MLRKAIIILFACLFVAALALFAYFILNPTQTTIEQEQVVETEERPLTKEEFQAQEEAQLIELLPENPEDIINTPEEIDAEVLRLQELLSQ